MLGVCGILVSMPRSRAQRFLLLVKRAKETIHLHHIVVDASLIVSAASALYLFAKDIAKTISTEVQTAGLHPIPSEYVTINNYLLILIVCVAVFLAVFVGVLTSSRNKLKHSLKSFALSSAEFRDLAVKHYMCDKYLFERLFCEPFDGRNSSIGALESTAVAIRNDIRSTIDHGAKIFAH
jgi:hypothetical protein